MLILGIDLGVANTGIAVVRLDPLGLEISKTIGVPLKTDARGIVSWYSSAVAEIVPAVDGVGMEDVTWFTKKQEANSRRRKDSMPSETMVKLGIVFGVLGARMLDAGLEVRSLSPPQLKARATGRRTASKDDMKAAVLRVFPEWTGTHHEADAICAALACWAPEVIACGTNVAAQ